MRKIAATAFACALLVAFAAPASAQYAVGHRAFGAGTAFGGGYSRMDYQFPGIEAGKPFLLLPTLELKVFLGDAFSLDLSVPIVNIAASNAMQKYFFFQAEAFADFHPSAPSSFELFVAPGFGVSYASWEGEDTYAGKTGSGYAFHIPVRVGFEINSARRNFSMFLAVRPFFSLVHGGSGNKAGGGGFLELGLMAYTTRYQADRY